MTQGRRTPRRDPAHLGVPWQSGEVNGAGTAVTSTPEASGWDDLVDDPAHVRHRRILPARQAVTADWPEWVAPDVVASFRAGGIERPWRHQVQAAEQLHRGRHTVIATGTASGKSLAYLLPVITHTLSPGPTARGAAPAAGARRVGPVGRASALYLSPTKALAHDQMRAARGLGIPGWRVGALDGDSDEHERAFARDHAHLVLSNPDMVHRSILANHRRWAGLLRSLRFIVIDECHRYRGVFGAHVAQVIRRLRRLCAQYGSDPVIVLASATTSDAGRAAAELIAEPPGSLAVVDEDCSPHGPVEVVLWEPTGHPDDEAAGLLADLVDRGRQVIGFVPSRVRAELVASRARHRVRRGGQIEAYRSGYLPGDRRSIEARLQDRSLDAVAATNALELGVDIAGVDAVVIAGFPGTLAALWQQAGRAGRRGAPALVVLVARKDPLDAYLFDHPELIFERPVESTVVHAENRYVLGPHLAAAAQESPLTTADERWFGPTMTTLTAQLCEQGVLRHRTAAVTATGGSVTGWFWPHPQRAVDSIDLRSLGGHPVDIVEADTGRVIGTVDPSAADRTVHEGAVYLHQGNTWLVDHWRPGDDQAIVRPDRPRYFTQPEAAHDVRIVGEAAQRPFFGSTLHWGEVEVSSQVTGYLRRDEVDGRVWDQTPLDMPRRTLLTHGVWWTVPAAVEAGLGWSGVKFGSAAHAAEHTAIGLLPMFAPCDRWDIGGLSTALHPDTGLVTVFVHDGHPGGSGFAERGYQIAEAWWIATVTRLLSCECEQGCPACVISPKCGNANQMLDKSGAAELLYALGVR